MEAATSDLPASPQPLQQERSTLASLIPSFLTPEPPSPNDQQQQQQQGDSAAEAGSPAAAAQRQPPAGSEAAAAPGAEGITPEGQEALRPASAEPQSAVKGGAPAEAAPPAPPSSEQLQPERDGEQGSDSRGRADVAMVDAVQPTATTVTESVASQLGGAADDAAEDAAAASPSGAAGSPAAAAVVVEGGAEEPWTAQQEERPEEQEGEMQEDAPSAEQHQQEQQEQQQQHGGEGAREERPPAPATPAAACSRANLQLVSTSRGDLLRLVEVQQLIAGVCRESGIAQPPRVLSGLVVRFHQSKAYRLSRLAGLAQGADGKPLLLLQDGPPAAINLLGASNTLPAGDEAAWAKSGEQEAAGLQAAIQASGTVWTPQQVASAAWHRKLGLAWHAFVAAIDGDQLAELPLLLSKLTDTGGVARLLARVEVEAAPGSDSTTAAAAAAGAGAAGVAGQRGQPAVAAALDVSETTQTAGAASVLLARMGEASVASGGSWPPGIARPSRPPPPAAAAAAAAAAGLEGAALPALPLEPTAAAGAGSQNATPKGGTVLAGAGRQPGSAFSASLFAGLQAPEPAAPAPEALRALLAAAAPPLPAINTAAVAVPAPIAAAAAAIEPLLQEQPPEAVLQWVQQVLARQGAAASAAQAAAAKAGGTGGGGDEQQRHMQQQAHQQVRPEGGAPPGEEQEQRQGKGQQQADSKPRRAGSEPAQGDSADAGGGQRRRHKQPITWQPQQSEPGDRPLLVAPAKGAPSAAAKAGSVPPGAGLAPEVLPPDTLTITRSFGPSKGKAVHKHPAVELERAHSGSQGPQGAGEDEGLLPVVHVDASRLRPESPEAALPGSTRAVHAAGEGNITLVVRNAGDREDSGGSGLVGPPPPMLRDAGFAPGLGSGAGGLGGAMAVPSGVLDPAAQQAALLAQLQHMQQLGQLPPGALAGGALTPAVLIAAQLLQQQQQQQQLAAAAAEQQRHAIGGPTIKVVLPPSAASERHRSSGELAEGGVGDEQQRYRSKAAKGEAEVQDKGRQVQLDAEDEGATEARVKLSVRTLDDARRHLERCTRAIVPSKGSRSAVQRAALQSLLAVGLRQEAPGLFVQLPVDPAQLGELLLKAARASKDVEAEYEKYGQQGRVSRLVADLERTGAVIRCDMGRGNTKVLLQVDRLEALADAAEGRQRGSKRARQDAEVPQPMPKHTRHEASPAAAAAVPPSPRREQRGPQPTGSLKGYPLISCTPTAQLRGTEAYADFWDPIWRFEHMLVRVLRSSTTGRMPLELLFDSYPLPEIYPRPTWETFVNFLTQRRHLFDIEGNMVGAVKGASALLQYKRDMMDYLASAQHPDFRTPLADLQRDVALPADMPPDLVHEAQDGQNGFWQFLTRNYREDIWLVAPKHYTSNLKTVELRPFQDPRPHPRTPRFRGLCGYFKFNSPGSCVKEQFCKFSHCAERVIH